MLYGIERRGKVIVTANCYYRATGAIITITTENYYVNDYNTKE
tara:strand:+ start:311 stop:439 length:129 start_codon:yes stop_codon:yes gene_type:complete